MKVLLLPVSAGHGHIKAAEALERTFHQTHRDVEIKNVDALAYMGGFARQVFQKGYSQISKSFPEFYKFLYRKAGQKNGLATFLTTPMPLVTEVGAAKLYRLIAQYKPDVVVSFHPLPASIVGYIRRHTGASIKHYVLLTDYGPHPYWIQPEVDGYFVLNEETKYFLVSRGIPTSQITVSGFPVIPSFLKELDSKTEKIKLGFDPKKPLALLFQLADFMGVIDELLKLDSPVQIVTICGKDTRQKKKIDVLIKDTPPIAKLINNGFIPSDEVFRLMSASDIIIGKPGGAVTTEVLIKRKPLVLTQAIPGQEEENADWLLENGLALKGHTPEVVAYKVKLLLNNPALIRKIQERQKYFAKPEAAKTIINYLISH